MPDENYTTVTIKIHIEDEDGQTNISTTDINTNDCKLIPWTIGTSVASIVFGMKQHFCGDIKDVLRAIKDYFDEEGLLDDEDE